jgi:hypothetical protein
MIGAIGCVENMAPIASLPIRLITHLVQVVNYQVQALRHRHIRYGSLSCHSIRDPFKNHVHLT